MKLAKSNISQRRKALNHLLGPILDIANSEAMLLFHFLLCAALARSASIIKAGAQSDNMLNILRSAYKNSNIIQLGSSDFNATNSSTPRLSAEAPRNASSANLGSVAICIDDPPTGGHPSYTSCLQALTLIPRDSQVRQFRSRSFLPNHPVDHSAPYRFLGC